MGERSDRELRVAAEAVLRRNDERAYTLPARGLYPHQWNWDSALCALGWAELDPARAWTELESLMGAADAAGMVPHIAFRTRGRGAVGERFHGIHTLIARPHARYMPGPRWWGRRTGSDGRRISGITQPPLAATCARLVFERDGDARRAGALLRPMVRWHRFLLGPRDPDGRGEPVVIHPWESGRDNSVEWDKPLWRVKPEVRVLHRRDVQAVDAAQRPSDDHYKRFLTLVRQGKRRDWDQRGLAAKGGFRVLDPGLSAILARACDDLAWLAHELGEPALEEESAATGERVANALRARTSPDGLLRAVDLVDDSELPDVSAGSALAALAPRLPRRTAEALRDAVTGGRLASDFGVRSLERGHPELNARNYWRGPVWTNITWLTAHGLSLHGEGESAAKLRERMVCAVAGSGMREYYMPDSGRGLGATDFAWSAALTLRELA